MKQIIAFSGGKDSTAMLLRMIELGENIDQIIFSDTGYEFQELYNYINKIEKIIERKITRVKPKSKFMDWAKGNVTRGKHKGDVRGFPLIAFPCYWTREAKVNPMAQMCKIADKVCIGIAYDERSRMSIMKDHKFRYPLIEWEWTEQDCVNYLNKKGLLNPLYVNFNRLGCWHCPKQAQGSLYVIWKLYPQYWQQMKEFEQWQLKEKGTLIYYKNLGELEIRFQNGYIPSKLPKYNCDHGCDGVTQAFEVMQCDLFSFSDINKKSSCNSTK